jgi:Flp pilus assembly protein TadG
VRLLSGERGQSIVELALVLPVMAFALLGAADMARAFAIQLAVQNGARAGAEAAAIDYSPTVNESEARTIDEMNRTPGMVAANATVTVTFKQIDGLTDCLNPPTVATPCYAKVRVQYTFSTITPWPLVPNSFALDRTTMMRMFVTP